MFLVIERRRSVLLSDISLFLVCVGCGDYFILLYFFYILDNEHGKKHSESKILACSMCDCELTFYIVLCFIHFQAFS